MCIYISNNPITLDLPIPHTNKILKFAQVADVENLESIKNSGKYVPDCYRIYKE